MSMNSIGNILKKTAPASPLLRGVMAARAVEATEKALLSMFGLIIKEHIQVISLKNGGVTIACLSSAVAQEIKLRETELIKQTNAIVGADVVKKIHYLL